MDYITESFHRLVRGNERFVKGELKHPYRDEGARLKTFAEGQKPFVAVLSCSDARVPVEIIFDQGLGDIFSIRNAGNVCTDGVIGSIELCVHNFGTPLVVVLGHSKCGAIRAAIDEPDLPGYIHSVLDPIKPIVRHVRSENEKETGCDLYCETTKANVNRSMLDIYQKSLLIRNLVHDRALRLETALYDLETGKIDWPGFEIPG